MKVLFQIRKDYKINIAGDTIVCENLRDALMRSGIQVDLCSEPVVNYSRYQIIHIFNTIRVQESLQFAKNAAAKNMKVALTPIYWDLREYYKEINETERIDAWNRNERKRKYIFDISALILPHCGGERELLYKNYKVPYEKQVIVPYGIKPLSMAYNEKYILSKYGVKDYILCVARVHHQKNQLSLLKAMEKEKIPIVLVGSLNDPKYLKECFHIKRDQVFYLEQIDRQALFSIYKEAKVHVLPSWVEFPGLVNLEAGAAGSNVVTTERGTAREVCKNYVSYCRPNDIQSIYEGTMKEYEKRKSNDFRDFIMANYTWDQAAQKIIQAYHSII
ncbi:MAG: glycosyltransferase family 4 protein [Bacillota bacterium]